MENVMRLYLWCDTAELLFGLLTLALTVGLVFEVAFRKVWY